VLSSSSGSDCTHETKLSITSLGAVYEQLITSNVDPHAAGASTSAYEEMSKLDWMESASGAQRLRASSAPFSGELVTYSCKSA
jgi:hypothetical protein